MTLTSITRALLFSLAITPWLCAQDATANKSLDLPATDEGLPGQGPVRRMDWFVNLWKSQRAKFASHTAQDQGAVVFLGDSITQGWGDDFKQSFSGMKLANRGISGDTTRGMLVRMDADVLACHPSAVVMLMGTNDLEEKATPEQITENVKLILAKLKADPKLPIILCQVFPSSATKARAAEQIKKINELYAAAVKGDRQVTFVETWTLFANATGDAKPEEFPDLLHPNDVGYKKWAAALKPLFATLGLAETEADAWSPEAGFTSLFNGKDLTGWGFRGQDGSITKFDGQTRSNDQRYLAQNGKLIVTTPPQRSLVAQLYTNEEFGKNFTLKLDFRATPNADSGVFLRKPQLQCRDYLLAGPYKTLTKYKPQDWNEMVVVVRDNVAHCTCNGEVLEAALALPPSGPIGLEGDRGQMEYRHLQLKSE
jgi:lysophospholipase L1-like esterase